MTVKLLNSWVVIEDLEPDEKQIGSIHIPEGSVDTPHKWARVLDVGKGKLTAKGGGWEEAEVQKGDEILYVRFLKRTETGKSLTKALEKEYGEGAFLIQERDILCRRQPE